MASKTSFLCWLGTRGRGTPLETSEESGVVHLYLLQNQGSDRRPGGEDLRVSCLGERHHLQVDGRAERCHDWPGEMVSHRVLIALDMANIGREFRYIYDKCRSCRGVREVAVGMTNVRGLWSV